MSDNEAMDASSQSLESEAELAELRRRAYGPDADIADDDVAQRRLIELEDAARPASSSQRALPAGLDRSDLDAVFAGVPSEQPADARFGLSPDAEATPVGVPSPGADDGVVVGDVADTQGAPWWRRNARWVAAGIAVLLVIGISATVTSLMAPRANYSMAPVATSDEDRAAFMRRSEGFQPMFDLESLQRYETYNGLTAWSAASDERGRCLVLEMEPYGVWGMSCTPAPLNPVIDLMLEGIPSEIAANLPSGSVVRFMLNGDRVDVWVAGGATKA